MVCAWRLHSHAIQPMVHGHLSRHWLAWELMAFKSCGRAMSTADGPYFSLDYQFSIGHARDSSFVWSACDETMSILEHQPFHRDQP